MNMRRTAGRSASPAAPRGAPLFRHCLGLRDRRGIVQRLDHLQWLGVDAVWISPFYPSPMDDFGYDVTDHRAVDRAYGSMVDFDRLVAEAHARGIRVIVDYIPNHTSWP